MLQNIIKVRCYGESLKIYKLEYDVRYTDKFHAVAKRLNQPIEEAILDIRFFEKLSVDRYQSIYDLQSSCFGGLINNFKSKIEIKIGRKRLQQLTMRDLTVQETLFPLFNIEMCSLQPRFNPGLFLIEQEVGMISEFSINSKSLNIDKLKFSITDLYFEGLHYNLLTNLSYNEDLLKSIKTDSLITYRYCQNKVNHSK